MPTYVDVEPLIKWCTYCADDDIVRVDRIVMANMLRNAPTVDAVEVVRCKDCIYYGDHGDGEMACAMMILYPNKPTDYCSLGEKKEDDT